MSDVSPEVDAIEVDTING